MVTGVTPILQRYGLDFIPQINCFLVYEDLRVDLTEGNCNGKNQTIEHYDFVVQVQPDIDEQLDIYYYLSYLKRYGEIDSRLAELSPETVLAIRDECERHLKYRCAIASDRPIVSL